MKVTRTAQVVKAIKEATGFSVALAKDEEGGYYFYSLEESTGNMLSGLVETSTYLSRLGDAPLSFWVEMFVGMLKAEENKAWMGLGVWTNESLEDM